LLAGRPNDSGLAARLPQLQVPVYPAVAAVRVDRYLRRDVAPVPGQPIQPRPGRIVSVAIGTNEELGTPGIRRRTREGAVMDDDVRELEPEISDHPFEPGSWPDACG
jgi:hypothetical protein